MGKRFGDVGNAQVNEVINAIESAKPKAAPVKKSQEKVTGKSHVKKSQEKPTGKSETHYKPDAARRSCRFEVNVTPGTGAAIKTAAQAAGVSVNEIINQAIIKYLKRGRR